MENSYQEAKKQTGLWKIPIKKRKKTGLWKLPIKRQENGTLENSYQKGKQIWTLEKSYQEARKTGSLDRILSKSKKTGLWKKNEICRGTLTSAASECVKQSKPKPYTSGCWTTLAKQATEVSIMGS